MQYFCITRYPINCRQVPEHTFFSYHTSEENEKEWHNELDYHVRFNLEHTERLILHRNIKIKEDDVKSILKFADLKFGYAATTSEADNLNDIIKWSECENCLLRAETRGIVFLYCNCSVRTK